MLPRQGRHASEKLVAFWMMMELWRRYSTHSQVNGETIQYTHNIIDLHVPLHWCCVYIGVDVCTHVCILYPTYMYM